jgi:inorganic pyrophosphatase/exopolyphosphatase
MASFDIKTEIVGDNYLTMIKNAFFLPSVNDKFFIMGNSSCDMDSVLSAYLLSIFENIRNKVIIPDKNKEHYYLNPATTRVYYPVVNCKRGTLLHRLDQKYVFNKFHVNADEFFYINDPQLCVETVTNSKNLMIILVDHSELPLDQKYMVPYVVELYDHHLVEHIEFPKCNKRFIKFPIGSCTTLILANFFLRDFPHSILDPLLAVTGILLDTYNFNKNLYKKRWSDLDIQLFSKIISKSKEPVDVGEYYNIISEEKRNVENNLALGIDNLLAKDQKTFVWNENKVQWSSLPLSYHKVRDKFGLKDIIEHIHKNCDGKFEYYVINSVIENHNKEFNIFLVDKKDFGDINKVKEELIKSCGDFYIGWDFDEENQVINLELTGASSRKGAEPCFRVVLNK